VALFFPAGSVGTGSESAHEGLGPGLLVNVSAFTESEDVGEADLWVTVDIVRGATANANRIAHIMHGYVTVYSPLCFHGMIEIGESDEILAVVLGNLSAGLRVTYEVITKTGEGQLLEYLRSVYTTAT